MAIAFDSASGPATVNPGTNVTQTHVTGSLTNGIMWIFVLSTLQDVSAVTYDGVSATQVGSYQVDFPAANRYLSVWGLLNPNVGSHTISVTTSSSNLIRVEGVTYGGVSQTLTPDAITQNQDTSGSTDPLTVNLTTVADDAWVVLFARAAASNINAGTSGATLRTTSNFNAILDEGPITPAGSMSLGATDSAGSSWGWIALSMAPAGGGSSLSPSASLSPSSSSSASQSPSSSASASLSPSSSASASRSPSSSASPSAGAPPMVKVWTGASWEYKPLKFWDGANWL